MGFIGYYRQFIKDYSKIARPLLDLTKITTPWYWDTAQNNAFECLHQCMCSKPVLHQPDFQKWFYVSTDASAYGMGTILSQEGESFIPSDDGKSSPKPRLYPVAFYSATLIPTEMNYDIYKRELLAIMKTLAHWRQYLIWTPEPFTILTDHANLLYWKSPRKLNQQTVRWHSELQDYDFKIVHVPGSTHAAADALSRPPEVDQGKEDNQDVTMIPNTSFI